MAGRRPGGCEGISTFLGSNVFGETSIDGASLIFYFKNLKKFMLWVFSLHVCTPVYVPDGPGGQMSTLDPLHLKLGTYGCCNLNPNPQQ